MLSRTPVVSSPSSSSKRRRRELVCRAKATSSKPNASTTKTPVPETKKTDVMMMSGKTQRRRDVFAVGVLFLSLGASSKESAFAYGTGGWKDCEPICDSLKGGFAAQQKLLQCTWPAKTPATSEPPWMASMIRVASMLVVPPPSAITSGPSPQHVTVLDRK